MRAGKVINFDGFHWEIEQNAEGMPDNIIN